MIQKESKHVALNPLNAKLNHICHLLALLAAHNILHLSRIMVNTENKKWDTGVDWLDFLKCILQIKIYSV